MGGRRAGETVAAGLLLRRGVAASRRADGLAGRFAVIRPLAVIVIRFGGDRQLDGERGAFALARPYGSYRRTPARNAW